LAVTRATVHSTLPTSVWSMTSLRDRSVSSVAVSSRIN
jgi:hypothetical protein